MPAQDPLVTRLRRRAAVAPTRELAALLTEAADAIDAVRLLECAGKGRAGKGRCCSRAGEYNGYGSDGPLAFRCAKGCSCHD
jgi:hypothetical protein